MTANRMARIEVDFGLCESNGLCEGHAPEIFELQDDDTLHVRLTDVPEDLVEQARAAEVSCPRQAILLRLEGP